MTVKAFAVPERLMATSSSKCPHPQKPCQQDAQAKPSSDSQSHATLRLSGCEVVSPLDIWTEA